MEMKIGGKAVNMSAPVATSVRRDGWKALLSLANMGKESTGRFLAGLDAPAASGGPSPSSSTAHPAWRPRSRPCCGRNCRSSADAA